MSELERFHATKVGIKRPPLPRKIIQGFPHFAKDPPPSDGHDDGEPVLVQCSKAPEPTPEPKPKPLDPAEVEARKKRLAKARALDDAVNVILSNQDHPEKAGHIGGEFARLDEVGATPQELFKALAKKQQQQQKQTQPTSQELEDEDEAEPTYIEFLSPSQILDYKPPADLVLIGDCHLTRGSVTVIGGPPGVGKSRSTLALAEAGATKFEWFGLTTKCQFKTMVIQAENGLLRLQTELAEIGQSSLEGHLLICSPPPFGLCFNNKKFREQLQRGAEDFGPQVVVIDPWNMAARDERAADYLETFDAIRAVFPPGDSGPAIVILAHTRKPTVGERADGRALLNLLVGSYVLGAVPRCVFVMQHASDLATEDRVVWTCCKNNDGELGPPSAWVRQNGLFTPAHGFDWEAWKSGDSQEALSSRDVVELVARAGQDGISRSELVTVLKARVSQATAYRRIDEAHATKKIKLHKRRYVVVEAVA